jgi:glycosyltransferase involved in cell wall biosynthesis
MGLPSVSVIIPAFNAEDTIAATLKALGAQTYRGTIEIIGVDDGSTDGTREILHAFSRVKYFRQDNAGPASARNLGARNASGDILMFTDSDCHPEPGWVDKLAAGFSTLDIAVVAGSYGIANPESWLARIIQGEILYRHQHLMPEYPRSFGSYNFAIRRSVFDSVGGFDQHYRRASGEDNDLSYKVLKAGGRIRFLKDALVAHHHQTRFVDYLKEQFRHGLWRVKIYADHPNMAQGDDYTFWKDILEIPVAVLSLVILMGLGAGYGCGFVLCFLILEILFGVLMLGKVFEGVAAGMMFLVRSYVRTAGFFVGGILFFNYLINK